MFWNRELLIRYVNQVLRSVSTDVVPSSDNTYSLGSSSYRWKNLYAVNIYATFLSLD